MGKKYKYKIEIPVGDSTKHFYKCEEGIIELDEPPEPKGIDTIGTELVEEVHSDEADKTVCGCGSSSICSVCNPLLKPKETPDSAKNAHTETPSDEPKTELDEMCGQVSDTISGLCGLNKPKETLEEKFYKIWSRFMGECTQTEELAQEFAQIAKEYYQENTHEIIDEMSWNDVCKKNGMVSLGKVLEVYDDVCEGVLGALECEGCCKTIRKALEGINKEKKNG